MNGLEPRLEVRSPLCVVAAIRHDVDLRTIGLDSRGYLNLLEGLERTFGVAIDLDKEPDHSFLHTIDNMARYLVAQQGAAA